MFMAVAAERIFPSDVPRRRRAFVSRGQQIRFYALLFAVAVLSICTWARGRGYISDLKQLMRPAANVASAAPSVAMTFPPDGAVGMPGDLEIVAEIKSARGGGID